MVEASIVACHKIYQFNTRCMIHKVQEINIKRFNFQALFNFNFPLPEGPPLVNLKRNKLKITCGKQ